MSFKEIMDREELQRLQDEFCEVTGFSAVCLNAEKVKISEMSGSREQLKKVAPYLDCREMYLALERVEEGSIEELAIENLPGGKGKVAAISVNIEGRVAIYWIVIELFEVKNITFARFEQALDLLRDGSKMFFRNRLGTISAEIKSRENESARKEMEISLETVEATTAVVQLLDSDDSVEKIMETWLSIVGNHLCVDTAQIFNLYDDDKKMDVCCEWLKEGITSFFEKKQAIEPYGFLRSDKPVVLSEGGLENSFGEEATKIGIKSVMVFPILKQDGGSRMVLSINYRSSHPYQMQEIKFAADAVRILQSILTKRIQKHSLASSFASLEAVLDNVGSAVYVVDKRTKKALFLNQKLRSTFEKQLQMKTLQRFMDKGVAIANGETTVELFYEEKSSWFDFSVKEIQWVDGRPALLYVLHDITDKKLYQGRIEQQAHTDFLTGLYNRMRCERDLEKLIEKAKEMKLPGSVLYLDLDDFKHINDGLGHQYGDVLLKNIALAMLHIEGIQDTCYRVGGDEFVIILAPEVNEQFDRIIQDIRKIFSRPWFLKNADYYCTMSMGVVTYPDSADTVADLIKKADIAMYEAKRGGKNRIAKYNDSFGTASDRRLDMEKNMREATVGGYQEFEVYYQPIIDVHKEEIECAGAEALIRWNSASLGFISPAEFIPLAEYLGLINPIGNYVLHEACRHCKKWNEKGYPNYKVNVNLSVVQLLQADIVDTVRLTLEETGIDPKNLTLEVTESLAINDMERMKVILNGIKALGVSIALDDFGTGYSSLNHIREIPFDIIKVDQSFVKDLAKDQYAKSFVKMVSELAEAIGVSVCVEGIETINQYAVLQGMKVKYIQGYFFDKPMPREAFEAKYVQ